MARAPLPRRRRSSSTARRRAFAQWSSPCPTSTSTRAWRMSSRRRWRWVVARVRLRPVKRPRSPSRRPAGSPQPVPLRKPGLPSGSAIAGRLAGTGVLRGCFAPAVIDCEEVRLSGEATDQTRKQRHATRTRRSRLRRMSASQPRSRENQNRLFFLLPRQGSSACCCILTRRRSRETHRILARASGWYMTFFAAGVILPSFSPLFPSCELDKPIHQTIIRHMYST